MAQYFLSQNPTINGFGSTNLLNIDRFFVDTGSASTLNIFQSGTNVVVTNGTNTATFTNTLLSQFAIYANNGNNNVVGTPSVSVTDGTQILIGTEAGEPLNGTTLAGGDYVLALGGNDTINTNGGGDFVNGNGGDDIINVNADDPANSANLGRAVTVFGGQGNDQIFADPSSRSALIFGNLGDDRILVGGPGNTFVSPTVFGGQGNDVIDGRTVGAGAGSNELLYGDIGNDLILGGIGRDTIFGGNDSDTINGGAGNDQLFGNQGADVIYSSAGAVGTDTVFGGQGADVIDYSGGTSGLLGNVPGFAPAGLATSAQVILGNLGSDTLVGGSAADTIYGGQGNDLIIASAGADVIFGDLGSDVIAYTANNQSTVASTQTINGFQTGVDRLFFTGGNYGTVSSANRYTEFANVNVNTAQAAVDAAVAATAAGTTVGQRDYVFVAGGTNGYLVEFAAGTQGAANVIGVQTLAGLNSIANFDFTDITTGANLAAVGTIA